MALPKTPNLFRGYSDPVINLVEGETTDNDKTPVASDLNTVTTKKDLVGLSCYFLVSMVIQQLRYKILQLNIHIHLKNFHKTFINNYVLENEFSLRSRPGLLLVWV